MRKHETVGHGDYDEQASGLVILMLLTPRRPHAHDVDNKVTIQNLHLNYEMRLWSAGRLRLRRGSFQQRHNENDGKM